MESNFLLDAYLRRKQWEFRAQAVAIVNLLGQAMGGAPGNKNGSYVSGYREISTDAMFERIGLNN